MMKRLIIFTFVSLGITFVCIGIYAAYLNINPQFPPKWTIVHQKTNEFYRGDNWGYTFDNYGCVQAGFTNREAVVKEIADMKSRIRMQAWVDFKSKFRKGDQSLRSSWDY